MATDRRPDTSAVPTVHLDGLARLELHEHAGEAVATLSGEVDISNVDELSRVLTRLPNQSAGLIIDLTATAYLDSAAISLLHELAGRLARRAQQLVLICPPTAPCRRVLDLTGLGLRAPVVDDLAAATAQVGLAI